MLFRQIDQDGDWTFGKGINNYARNNEAISLNIKTRLLSWAGDCFFDLNAGIDWTNRLGNKNQFDLLSLDIRKIILETEGVTGLVRFDTKLLKGRKFDASYTVTTTFSTEFQDNLEVQV